MVFFEWFKEKRCIHIRGWISPYDNFDVASGATHLEQ
jgi:hypothetical protein